MPSYTMINYVIKPCGVVARSAKSDKPVTGKPRRQTGRQVNRSKKVIFSHRADAGDSDSDAEGREELTITISPTRQATFNSMEREGE